MLSLPALVDYTCCTAVDQCLDLLPCSSPLTAYRVPCFLAPLDYKYLFAIASCLDLLLCSSPLQIPHLTYFHAPGTYPCSTWEHRLPCLPAATCFWQRGTRAPPGPSEQPGPMRKGRPLISSASDRVCVTAPVKSPKNRKNERT